MSKYSVFGLQMNYNGSYGKAEPDMLLNPLANRFETDIMGDELKQTVMAMHGDGDSELRRFQLSSNQIRDMAIDAANPTEELPADFLSVMQAEIIPDFTPVMRDLGTPEDDKSHNQVALVQQGRLNYLRQQTLYDDPKVFESNLGKEDQTSTMPMQASKFWEYSAPSATGSITYHLDSDGNKLGMIENTVAF